MEARGGPIRALIATLTDLGWTADSCGHWYDAGFRQFVFEPGQPYAPILRHVVDTPLDAVWTPASQHYLGAGLQRRGPHSDTLKLLKWCRSDNDPVSAGLMECVLVGGF